MCQYISKSEGSGGEYSCRKMPCTPQIQGLFALAILLSMSFYSSITAMRHKRVHYIYIFFNSMNSMSVFKNPECCLYDNYWNKWKIFILSVNDKWKRKLSTENNVFWCDSCPAVWENTLTQRFSSTYFEPSKRFRNKRKITGDHGS